jgi:hypothetical protein
MSYLNPSSSVSCVSSSGSGSGSSVYNVNTLNFGSGPFSPSSGSSYSQYTPSYTPSSQCPSYYSSSSSSSFASSDLKAKPR